LRLSDAVRPGRKGLDRDLGGSLIEIVPGHYVDKELYNYLMQYMSDSELDSLFNAARKPPSRYYVRVNTMKISRDELLSRLRARGIEVYSDESLEEALWFPIKGPHRVPSADKLVLANKWASESVYMGADLYIPGVVRFEDGVNRGDEVNVIAPNGEVVAYGIAEVSGDEVKKLRSGVAVRVLRSVYEAPKVRNLPEHELGLIYEQSLPAQYVAHVVDPKPGEVIVDMNASPGGKASHIIQLGGSRVFLFDRSPRKVAILEENLRRLGMGGLYIAEARDTRYIHIDRADLVGSVDKVLVDPPCSDMGVRPRLFDVKTMRDILALAEYQRQFIVAAFNLLRPGGALVYSTCTIPPLENEDNARFAEGLGMEISPINVGASSRGYGINAARFLPHIHDTPGFFIVKLLRRR